MNSSACQGQKHQLKHKPQQAAQNQVPKEKKSTLKLMYAGFHSLKKLNMNFSRSTR
jgi:hypothetical protein